MTTFRNPLYWAGLGLILMSTALAPDDWRWMLSIALAYVAGLVIGRAVSRG